MRFCRSPFLVASLAFACAFAAPLARAQEPVAVISVAPLSRLKTDVSYVLDATNFGALAPSINLYLDFYTKGIDLDRPIAVQVTLQDQVPAALICVPVTDFSELSEALGGLGVETIDNGKDRYELLSPVGPPIYAKDAGNWLFLAQSDEQLDGDLPENPAQLLGKFPEQYDVAVRLNMTALPADMKAMITDQMRMGFESGLAAQSGQTDAEREQAKESGEAQIAQLERMLTELDKVFIGWSISPNKQMTFIDAGAQFQEGTQLAAQANLAGKTTTSYKQFILPNASASFRFSQEIPESERPAAVQNFRNSIGQLTTMIKKEAGPQAEVAEKLIGSLASVMEKTINEGKFDGAGSISVSGESPSVLIGGRVADGSALAAELQKIAGEVKASENEVKFEFNYGNYKGVDLHRVTVSTQGDPKLTDILGSNVEIIIGTADKGYLISMDSSGEAAAKAAIDTLAASSPEAAAPFESVLRLEQILTFASSIAPNSILDNAVSAIGEFAGKDTVQLNGRAITRGAVYRLSIDEGVLRAAGAAGQGGAGGGF